MEEEYRASGAGKVFKAPERELTDEEKKQKIDMEKERYLKDPDQEDLSQQVNYSKEIDVESLTNQQKQKEDAKKWKEFDDAVAGAKSKEDLIEAGKIRKRLEGNWVSLATLAGETFIGIGADVTTPALLGTPLAPLYYPINYGIGYGTNILGQWLRGEEIKQGRAHAAGAFQTIPLGTTAKGLKGIARATGKGAVGSVVGEQVAVGIDEKRVLTPEEVAYAGAFGGTFGGISKSALDNVDITGLRNTLNRLSKKRQVIVNLDGTLSIADDSIDGSKPLMSKGDTSGEDSLDDLKRKVIKDNLESDIVTRFLLGKTTKLPKQHRTLIQNSVLGEVTDADFKGTSGVSVPIRPGYIPTTEAYTDYVRPGGRLDQLIEEFPNMKNKFEGLKGSFLWNEHHINHRTAPIDFYVGRTDVAERNKIRDLLIDEFNIFSGNSPLNRVGLPTGLEEADVHTMVHSWLAPRLGERSDVLKAKWAKEVGLKLGPLQTRQSGRPGYLKGQQYLNDADRVTWNNYMSQLPVDGKLMKRFIREYGALIKESEVLIEKLMKQFDAFYRVPKSYQVEVTPDDLVAVLDDIDPTKEITLPLIERTIREVLEDKKLNMINPVTKEIVGVVQKSEKELNMLFRSDDLLSMLDAANKPGWTGSNKQIDSWAKELNEIYMELGIFPKGQLSFDIQKGKISSYLEKMKKARFGDTTLSEMDKPPIIDPKIQDIIDE